mgnify:CR=1 FL=1
MNSQRERKENSAAKPTSGNNASTKGGNKPADAQRQKFLFLLLILFVFGVPAFTTLPIARLVPIKYMLLTILIFGFAWLIALIYFGEVLSRGVDLPIPTEGLLIIATFFLMLVIWGMKPIREIGYLWMGGFVAISGGLLRLYRAKGSIREFFDLILSMALIIAIYLAMRFTKLDHLFGILLVVAMVIYWYILSPLCKPKET